MQAFASVADWRSFVSAICITAAVVQYVGAAVYALIASGLTPKKRATLVALPVLWLTAQVAQLVGAYLEVARVMASFGSDSFGELLMAVAANGGAVAAFLWALSGTAMILVVAAARSAIDR